MITKKFKQYWQASSIRKKLLATFTLVNMVAVMFMVLMLSIGQYFSLKSNLISNIAVQSEMLSEMIAPALLFDDKSNAIELLSGFKHSIFVLRAEVVSENQSVYAEYFAVNLPHEQHLPIASLSARFDQMQLTYPIIVNKRQFAMLRVLISLQPLYESLFWFSAMALLITVLALGISFYLGKYVLNSISESIIHLTLFVKNLALNRDYSVRYPNLKTQDEVTDLAKGFNLLLGTIESREINLQEELARRKQAEANFEQLAMFDNVTGLPNRNHFCRNAQNLIEASASSNVAFYLMFVDLDDFKIINDTYGHRAGDLLLCAVGERISRSLQGAGDVFRIGGDEFAILITKEVTLSEIDAMSEDIIYQLNQPVKLDEHTGYVGASIGICRYPQQAVNYTDLLSRADAAMYQAKASNKNCFVHFNQKLEQKIIHQQTLENGLRDALHQQQFLLYYQPIVNLQTLHIDGFEALIRWQHPTFGLVSPAEFIPIAEKTGQIVEIGHWVMETACHQVKAWQDEFQQAFTIAVNVSLKQLNGNHLIEHIRASLQASLLPPESLHIELTESSLADDIESAIAKMHMFKSLGVSILLDDFGTGFSSLTQLKKLPIECLKLDKSFIEPLPFDDDATAIVNATIAMTSALNIGFVAEGVENISQLNMLASFKGQVQGYFLSHPLPAQELENLLRTLPANACFQIADLSKKHDMRERKIS